MNKNKKPITPTDFDIVSENPFSMVACTTLTTWDAVIAKAQSVSPLRGRLKWRAADSDDDVCQCPKCQSQVKEKTNPFLCADYPQRLHFRLTCFINFQPPPKVHAQLPVEVTGSSDGLDDGLDARQELE